MTKKDLLFKGLAVLMDLIAAWILPLCAEKLRSGPMRKEQEVMLQEQIQLYMESH